jgi:replication-associated recombination protein RarA
VRIRSHSNMRNRSEPFVEKYSPTKLEDFVMVKNRHYDLLKDFFQNPSVSHWLLHGHPGLGKSTMADLMARRVTNNNPGLVWHLIGNEVNQKVLAEIADKTQLRPSGLFHAVIIEEIDAISPFCRTSLLKTLDPKGANADKNTCWFLTSNEEPERAVGDRIKSRINRVLFTSEGICGPAAEWLIKIADLEGFVLSKSQATKLVQESTNNIREAMSELERRCRTGRIPRKDAPPQEMREAA